MNVLLLNKSFEVIKIIDWQRAICLLFNGKADKPYYEYEYHHKIDTVNGEFELPTTLALNEYVKIPYRQIRITKRNVLIRDKYKCQYCGKQLKTQEATIDHIVPRSRGGKHEWNNVTISCKPCNNKKDSMLPEEAGMKLLSKPYRPTPDMFAKDSSRTLERKEWEKFFYN